MPTNPFTSSSSSNRRQQILVPKELFPRKNSSGLNNGVDLSSSSSSSSYRRPVKLPLRKHHSFHFQSSQTVAGTLKHEQFQPSKQSSALSAAAAPTNQQQSTKERYRNQGPLVFKPFSEKSAFIPIVPSPSAHNSTVAAAAAATEPSSNGYDVSTMPRICGTSLKRHISNVETFSTAINQWNQSDDNDDDDDNVTVQNAQPSMGDVNRRRKIHYADLAPLPTPSAATAAAAHVASNVNAIYQQNDRNNNGSSNENSDNIDSCSSSGGGGSDGHTSTNNAKAVDHKTMNTSSSSSSAATTTTQYATLRFDEVSI